MAVWILKTIQVEAQKESKGFTINGNRCGTGTLKIMKFASGVGFFIERRSEELGEMIFRGT